MDLAAERLKAKGEVIGFAADISNPDDVRRLFIQTQATFGGLDILVNNAGIRTYKPVADLEPAAWDRMLAVNLSGPFYCSREALRFFRPQGRGDIVHISSLSSTSAFAGGAAYNASKAGLHGLADATMLDHRYDGVRDFRGPAGQHRYRFRPRGLHRATLLPEPSGKSTPADIAEAVVFLLRMPRRITVSRIDVKPSLPPRKSTA